jgi:hypothetical protein
LVFKVINVELTYDEAYTFLNYVYTDDVFNIGIANNHILNSFLIALTTKLGYSEFFLRLPNLLSGILYILFIYKFLKRSNYKTVGYVLLLSNPYILDFFSIGRGYGISVFLIFISSYIFLTSKGNEILIPIILLSIASFSYHITVLLLISFWIINIKKIFTDLDKVKSIFINLLVIGVTIVNSYILFNITSPGKPLYGINNLTLNDLLIGSFGFTSIYLNKNIYFSIFINLLFILPILKFNKLTSHYKSFFYTSYLTIFSIYAVPFIFGKPFPLLRTVFPFFIPIILLIFEAINLHFANLKKLTIFIFSTILILTLSINLILQIELFETIDWKDDPSKKYILQRETISGEYKISKNDIGPVGEYYRLLYEIETNRD